MNDELKEWIRILKFGMPSVASYAFILSGMGLVLQYNEIIQLKGVIFCLLGILIIEVTDNYRQTKHHMKFVKTIKELVENDKGIEGINGKEA